MRYGFGRRLLRLILWMGLLVLAMWSSVRLGRGSLASPPILHPSTWDEWANGRDPVVCAFAAIRVVVLAAASYLMAITTIGLTVRVAGVPRLIASVDLVTLPAVRRLLHGAVGMALITAPVIVTWPVPAGALDDIAATTTTVTTTIADANPAGDTATMRLLPDEPPPSPAPQPAIPAPIVTGPRAVSIEVKPGDSFWSIAAAIVTRADGASNDDPRVVKYWRALIEANRGSLVDPANPDLIYPGQVLVVPAVG